MHIECGVVCVGGYKVVWYVWVGISMVCVSGYKVWCGVICMCAYRVWCGMCGWV